MGRHRTSNEARAKLARQAARLNASNAAGRKLPAIVLMTDDTRDRDWLGAARALPKGGAVVVRHRDARKREELARRLAPACRTRGIKLLIADDPALAQRVRADGVHLPQRRMASIKGIKAGHPRWLVTCSAHGASSVGAASRLGADAIFVAPVFATSSHPGRGGLGVVRFAALSNAGRTPVYALGGIDATSVQRLIGQRVSGIALIGGWTEDKKAVAIRS